MDENKLIMSDKHFTATLVVNERPENVFHAINYVRGWWSEALEGNSAELHDEFIYRHKDMHFSKQKLVEVIPFEKVAWLVTESSLSFLKHKKDAWTGTQIDFVITKKNDKTELVFTHIGLVPGIECFSACSTGWNYYLYKSLLPLITTGKGQPDKKENSVTVKPGTIV